MQFCSSIGVRVSTAVGKLLQLTSQPSGYYVGAVLRFQITFPNDYPERTPTVQFVTDIFHPLIDQKGNFHLNSHLRPWKCVCLLLSLSFLRETFFVAF